MQRIEEEIIQEMVKDLKEGILKELLEKVRNDDTLSLEFRRNYLSIYYRGGSVSKLVYKSNQEYEDCFDNKYNKMENSEEEDNSFDVQGIVTSREDCRRLVERIIARKEIMNDYFKRYPKREREYQQLVERENNDHEQSNYYIVDIEYNNDDSRFDMIAIQRKDGKDYTKLKLAILEMKYREKAIGEECGLYDHYTGVKGLSKEKIIDIIEDAEIMMNYKNELGFVKTREYIDRGIGIKTRDEIDLIFFISGITQKHTNNVIKELRRIKEDMEKDEEMKKREIKLNIKVFCSYMAGNIMFDKDVITLDNFLKLVEFRKSIE